MAVSRSSALAVNQAKDFVVAGRSFSSSIGPAPNATPAAQRLAIGHQPSDHRTTPVTRDQLGSQPEACVPNFHRISTEWRLLDTVGLHFVESFNSMATLSTKGAPMVNETEHTHTHTHTHSKKTLTKTNKRHIGASSRFTDKAVGHCVPIRSNALTRRNKTKAPKRRSSRDVFFLRRHINSVLFFVDCFVRVCVCFIPKNRIAFTRRRRLQNRSRHHRRGDSIN